MASPRPLTFFDVTVPVTTNRQSIVALVVAYFAANRPDDLTQAGALDFTAFSRVQYTADAANTQTIVVGDYTASFGTPSQGTELTASGPVNGFYEQSYSQVQSIDITQRYAVASADGGFLHVRAYR